MLTKEDKDKIKEQYKKFWTTEELRKKIKAIKDNIHDDKLVIKIAKEVIAERGNK